MQGERELRRVDVVAEVPLGDARAEDLRNGLVQVGVVANELVADRPGPVVVAAATA